MPAIPASALRHVSDPRDVSSFLSDTASRVRLRSIEQQVPPSIPELHRKLLDRSSSGLFGLPASYRNLNSGPSAGTVVGITLGSVFGFLILMWLLLTMATNRAPQQFVEGDESEIVVTARRERTSSSRHKRRHRHHSVSSVSSRPAPKAKSPRRTERILVQERRRTESRAPPRSGSRVEEERININIRETERRVDGDDEVQVIEESVSDISPDPRRKSRRATNANRRSSGR